MTVIQDCGCDDTEGHICIQHELQENAWLGGAADERRSIVEWLRKVWPAEDYRDGDAFDNAADRIERGEHRTADSHPSE